MPSDRHIFAYLGRIADGGVSLETGHRRHREVRFLFSWLERMDYIEDNPFARIKDQAAGGEILLPEAVCRLLSGKPFLVSNRGDVALKGFEDPFRLYEVRWRE
jgi:site-specific recombinase XerD